MPKVTLYSCPIQKHLTPLILICTGLLLFTNPGCSGEKVEPDSGGTVQGTEGAPCYPNGTCNAELTCKAGVCSRNSGDSGLDAAVTGPDSNQTDAVIIPPCVKVKHYETRLNQPTQSSIAVVFGVESCQGDPVTGLAVGDFTLLEDDTPVSKTESQAALLPRPAEFYIALVMDNSPSVKESGALNSAVSAAIDFTNKVMTGNVWVSVSFFSKALVVKQDYTQDKNAVQAALNALLTDTSGSNTTNLYGALIDVIENSAKHQSQRRTDQRDGVFTLGQIVLFTDGTDQAAAKPLQQAQSAVDHTADDVVTIAFGGEVDKMVLAALGKNGSYTASNAEDLAQVFTDAANRATTLQNRVYVIGYCSPKLAGNHQLVIEVGQGIGKSDPIAFDATGFGDGECSSEQFNAACDDKQCGGLLCGACGSGTTCTTSDQCTSCLSGMCDIDGNCYAAGATKPINTCQECHPAENPTSWTSVGNGTICDDENPCTYGDHCSNGTCSGTPYTCDDGLNCTTDTCNGSGPPPSGCSNQLQSAHCLINGVCYLDGDINPSDACEMCDSSTSTSNWSVGVPGIGCECIPEEKRPCGSNIGECIQGEQVCNQDSKWGPCLGAKDPVAENITGCDGKDNNCDNLIDNGLDPDGAENNNECLYAQPYTVIDTNPVYTEKTLTLYPEGDVDYFRIIAEEHAEANTWPNGPCCPWPFCDPPDAQCNFLDVELVDPLQVGLDYQFSILTDNCNSPTQTFTSTSAMTVQWEGSCGMGDSNDFWIKVEPIYSSVPLFSCKPYTLKFRYRKEEAHCCIFVSCSGPGDSVCATKGCGACSNGKCSQP